MHDSIVISTCFSLSDHQRLTDEPTNVGRSAQSIFKFYFIIDGTTVDVVWDFKAGNFNGETEPQSDYYVAIVCEDEDVLLLDAYRKTGCKPCLIEPMLVFRREHIFGNKKFTMRVNFNENGAFHVISVVCSSDGMDPVLEIRVDGKLTIKVKHLQ
ncbi:hypothetical protein CXB51_004884 [Gossypium anomalum]|uniref:Uncharacterized protein n=1 Tax=Gossypium anomalum TaxID=47600 RepID=A0A8J5Z1Y5_9ROSI|nr:hypothetical protein CXB51_004884 [Gossypium anomalum]